MAHQLRAHLRRVGALDSAWHLVIELGVLAGHMLSRERATYERRFSRRSDPWDYAGAAARHRHRDALALLDSVLGSKRSGRFEAALEIGCAEGAFTEALSARCRSLLAVDFAPTALARARRRCAWPGHVSFAEWELKRDVPPAEWGAFDLVVVMDVLEEGFGPLALRSARDRLVDALRPGGALLVGNSRQSPVFETSAWGKALIRGGRNINSFFEAHAGLTLRAQRLADGYVLTLLERVA